MNMAKNKTNKKSKWNIVMIVLISGISLAAIGGGALLIWLLNSI